MAEIPVEKVFHSPGGIMGSSRYEGEYCTLSAAVGLEGVPRENLLGGYMVAKEFHAMPGKATVYGVFKSHWFDLSTLKGATDFQSSLISEHMRDEEELDVRDIRIMAKGHDGFSQYALLSVFQVMFPEQYAALIVKAECSSRRAEIETEKWAKKAQSIDDLGDDGDCQGLDQKVSKTA